MTAESARDLLNVIQLLGAPLVVLYAIHRGWLATRREVELLQSSLETLQARYATLEAQMRDEQSRMRAELEVTRSQLIELLMRDGSRDDAG
jgi:hypothetical protein